MHRHKEFYVSISPNQKKKKKSLQVIQIDQTEEDTATGVLVSKGTLVLSIIKSWLK